MSTLLFKMLSIGLILTILTYVSTVLLISVNFFSIRHLLKVQDSNGISKISFWLLFLSFCILDLYSIYYMIYVLIVSYTVQAIMILIYLYYIYKYDKKGMIIEDVNNSHVCIDIGDVHTNTMVL